ncbi:MAG: demethoxyubiquinone hydroxylase family protein [SAR116 cluster bacterium MED-G04]|jgi:ubiquinone biosynthesis monooxygenase Coq7|nr:demethoxyubiquinone hydroxylase family protein [SAR116 cluster bacterium]OUW36624.1 MAG: demethoxyubiquinone hydroxylase family protein [Gammaproteobacteria bacterium TMED183]PDH66564.1 MAG: demethoxyubiquinone hydroxylase family protein [SAR116 cluster bacterium MED-G04]HCD50208.1 demethoxyubiquinone hydroxylase family protein [Alphaproteobacteria bacterium]CAI8435483.1 MAG: 2-nonaprenyl-3-methyl-6-methoxy-1,4-benzoquinol hydroxylase [SAR116 cluster bacterium MED-G04]|tara:strand:+ start:9940 stop:10461 length:522 start_codon:yes stop_codon:yes gene_type:complete
MTEEMKSRIDRFLRVDHAGELGAKRIYQGQLAVLKNHPVAPEIEHMKEQEQHHLDTFENLINEYQTRPSVLTPLWNGAGFMLGAVTAAMGPKAAMACTIAVEEVIGEHYREQAETLDDSEAELRATLRQFRDEELEHRDTAIDHDGEDAVGYPVLRQIISTGCRTAIKLAEKI